MKLYGVISIVVLACLVGCKSAHKCADPIVHPSDEQIERGGNGGANNDKPYTPWWVLK